MPPPDSRITPGIPAPQSTEKNYHAILEARFPAFEKMSRTIRSIITAVTGDRVIIGESELQHASIEHFPMLPQDMLLELIERVLKDPTKIFKQEKLHLYHLFYRLDNGKYLAVIVKKAKTGSYFCSMYSTGNSIRNSHNGLKEIYP